MSSKRSKNKVSYLPLITAWENYLQATPQGDLENFAVWLLHTRREQRKPTEMQEALDGYFDKNNSENNYGYRSSEAAFLLWRLNKFVRFYTRSVLTQNSLAGQDDFAVMAHVHYREICTKKEAIESNVLDQTTGIDVINRLIRKGLLVEKSNDLDRREKMISLTEQGKETMGKIYVGFQSIQDVMADLTKNERENLIKVLKNLDDFHTRNHANIIKKK